MAEQVLRLDRVTKRFGKFVALDELSLEVAEGEILTLLGPSGCGKTTTLRILAGLETPDAGDVFFKDRPLVSVSNRIFVPAHKRNMGMVFQSYAIWPHMTVYENVAYPLKVRGIRRSEISKRVSEALELVGLAGLEGRQGPHLSGGQQQRVALARALVYNPSILLMDEPFSNLDAKLREQMRVQIKLLLKRLTNMTVVFVTHDQIEALSLSDRVVLMKQGKVEQAGPPRLLYERPATPFVRDFLGRTVLLRGTVLGGGAQDQVRVQLRGLDHVISAPANTEGEEMPVGADVLMAIRPEEIQLRTDLNGSAPAPNELRGTIDALLFVGEHYECRIKLGEDRVLLNVPRTAIIREGQQVRLDLAPEGVTVWRT